MIYTTGPDGEHMNIETLENAISVFQKTRSNVLGLAGGEALEHPDFWFIIDRLRDLSILNGFVVKVATSGEPFDKDHSLIKRAVDAAPVLFQVTRTSPFYGNLKTITELRNCSNFYFNSIDLFYNGKKSKERGFKKPKGYFERQSLFCEPAWWLRKCIGKTNDFGSFIRQWEGIHSLCSVHIHPDGSIRMGPLDCCQVIGDVFSMDKDFTKEGMLAMDSIGDKPCRACGLKGRIR